MSPDEQQVRDWIATRPGRGSSWDLTDLAAVGDLAAEFGVSNATISNWTARYADFPAPLTTLSTGAVYSRRQVRQWHDQRWPTFRKNQRRQ